MNGFSDSTIVSVLNAARNAYITEDSGNWVSVYTAITQAIASNDPAMAAADPRALTWINGATDVNSLTGSFADYIWNYTAAQYRDRTGQALDKIVLRESSNQIASNFAFQFLFGLNATTTPGIPRDSTGAIDWTRLYNPDTGAILVDSLVLNPSVPSLQTIGSIDAGAAAAWVFKDGASSTGLPNYSPWAGTVLFTNLGDDSFFKKWILDPNPNTELLGRKVESGSYDLISVAEATAQAASLSGILGQLIDLDRFSFLLHLRSVNSDVISDATSAAQTFFEGVYGSELSGTRIGDAIFSLLGPGLTSTMTYQIGTVKDDSVNLDPNTRVLNTGPGNDTVTVVAVQQSAPSPVVVDGGEGNNVLAYRNNELALTVTLQNGGMWGFRERVDLGAHGTEYTYNFQTLKLSGNGDKVIWGSDFSPRGITGAGAAGPIKIIEEASSSDANNTLDLSGISGGIGLKSSSDGAELELFQNPKFRQTDVAPNFYPVVTRVWRLNSLV